MNDRAFDSLVRSAGSSQNRRASLKVLGAAALAAAGTVPLAAEASKAGKKAKKKCKKQGGQCRTFVQEECADDPNPEECFNENEPCCAFLAKCKFGVFIDCLVEASE